MIRSPAFSRRLLLQAAPTLAAGGLLAAGCASPPPQRVFVVFFQQDSVVPDTDAATILSRASEAAKLYAADPVHVIGFADPAGTPDVNRMLSQQRAEAVSAYLAQHGVPPTRMIRTARGPTEPSLAMVESRRVEIRIGALPPPSAY